MSSVTIKYSPLRLIQEELHHNPWQMLVACIMLNQTSYKQVRPMIDSVFAKWPTAEAMARADKQELSSAVRSLGFYNRRSKALIRFSYEWITKCWSHPRELYGIGKYASDSYDMFVLCAVERR